MNRTYSFYEAGCIPGIPGTFAGVRVTVDEDTHQVLDTKPLSLAPSQDILASEVAQISDEIKNLEAALAEIEHQPH